MMHDETPGIPGPNPYVFIVGCPWSDLTLLARIVDAHAQVAIIPDVSWITDNFRTRTGIVADGLVTPDLVAKWHQRKLFDPFAITVQEMLPPAAKKKWKPNDALVPGRAVPCKEFLVRLFNLCATSRGKGFVGSLSPGYVRRIRVLHGLWPSAKF